MNEETKNFSALVLQKKILTEDQVEECIAHQESMALHGLEKPIWVIALEKGYLPESKYKDVVLGVRWVGVRQQDRRFGEFAVKKGYLIQEELDTALSAQENLFGNAQKVRRLEDILVEQGVLKEAQKREIQAELKAGEVPTVEAPVLEDVPTIDEGGVVRVEEVASLDDLMAGVVEPEDAGSITIEDIHISEIQPTIEDAAELPTIVEPTEPAAPFVEPKAAPEIEEPAVPAQARKRKPAKKGPVDGEAPTIVRKVGKKGKKKKKKRAPVPPADSGDILEPKSDLISDTAFEKKDRKVAREKGIKGTRRATKAMTVREKRATKKTPEAPKGKGKEKEKAKAKGPPMLLIGGAVGGLGCLGVIALVVVVVIPLFTASPTDGSGEAITPGEETPGEETPGDETPGEVTPGEDTPGEETPGEETPGDETPGEVTPGEETPGEETPGEETPGDETPGESSEATAARKLEEAGVEREGGRFAEALEILREIEKDYSQTPAGSQALELIVTVEAEERCSSALESGKEALEGGDLEGAESALADGRKENVLESEVEAFARALEDEKTCRNHIEEGERLLADGDAPGAIEAFQKARDLADRASAREGLARARSELLASEAETAAGEGRHEDALRAFEEAKGLLEAEGLPVPDRIGEGVNAAKAGSVEAAKEALRSSLEPLMAAGKWKDVVSMLEEYVGRFGEDPELKELLDRARSMAQAPAVGPTTKNEKGFDEMTNPTDGSILVLIPPGEFKMGSGRGDADQKPEHKVRLSEYWISRNEVTNQQYARFLNECGKDKDAKGRRMVYPMGMGLQKTGGVWAPVTGYEKHPVVGVTWYGARAYCHWAGGDLPTEAQWEKAARGVDGRVFPWGSQKPDSKRAVFGTSSKKTEAVGSRPEGASPYGVMDMAGNVWEWCRDAYDAKYYGRRPGDDPFNDTGGKRVLRGGGFKFSERLLDPANRIAHSPTTNNTYFGFRIVIEKRSR